MRKVFIIILIFLSVIAIVIRYGSKPFGQALGLIARSGLRVEASQPAKVLLNNKEVGVTPFQSDEFTEGEYLLSLLPSQDNPPSNFSWQGYVRLNGGTLTVVNRDLAQNTATSSGEMITLEKGQGATVVSTPNQAVLEVDGKNIGKTPLSLSNLAPGEHQFILFKEGYLKRSIRAKLVDGYNLTLTVDLAMTEPDLSIVPISPVSSNPQVVVRQTPTGFLRVRSAPTTVSNEVTRLLVGDIVALLEEQPGWYKIRTTDGKEGYVSTNFVQKKSQ